MKTIGTKFRPSNADRYLNCPASVVLSQDLPVDEGTIHADTGTVAHALAEKCILEAKDAGEYLGQKLCVDKNIDLPVTEEILSPVQEYVNWIREQEFTDIWMEKEVSLPWVKNAGGEKTTGKADLVGYIKDFNTLMVVDYKNGVLPVPDESYQFACYAYPLLFDEDSQFNKLDSVTTVRFQPNVIGGSPIGTHEWTRGNLSRLKHQIEFAVTWVGKTKKAKLKDKDFCEGQWCKFCPSSHQCPSKCKTMFDVVKPGESLPAPSILTPEKIKLILEKRSDIKNWVDDVYNYYLAQAINGNVLTGMKLVEGRSSPRAWDKNLSEAEIVSILDSRAGIFSSDCYQPAKIVSPATVKKLLKGKLDIIEDILEPVKKSLSLVTESDSRDSANSSADFTSLD